MIVFACTLLSAAALTATLNCFVLNSSAACEFGSQAMPLAKSRRMISPTAMGRIPAFNFVNAVSFALIE